MSKSKNTNSQKTNSSYFYSYKPAELRINTQWLIVYYYKHPVSNKFVRVRVTVPKVKSKAERKRLAIQMTTNINLKLSQGWLPIYDTEKELYITIAAASEQFINITKKDIDKGIKRPDTLRGYASILKMFNLFIDEQTTVKMLFEIKKFHVVKYLDWILYGRNNSVRTFNNHLRFLSTFASFCIDRGFIQQNFTTGIKTKAKETKKRKAFDTEIKEVVKQIQKDDETFYTLCMLTYFCFIRRTELTKLVVKNVNLKENYIFLPGSITKNKKDSHVTIPKAFKYLLAKHIGNAKQNDYLFSGNGFKAGKLQLKPKKVSDTWKKYQEKYKLDSSYQFYSLKDTGITDLLHSGVPAIVVRDQARHYDLKITESYAGRNTKADDAILNIDFTF